MERYLTFSTQFPAYHPRKGEPTYFIEKIWSGLLRMDAFWYGQFLTDPQDSAKHSESFSRLRKYDPKYHTIRAGHRFNVGDSIIPWHWSGKPYASKWVKPFHNGDLAIPVTNVWDFQIDENGICSLGGKYVFDNDDGSPSEAEVLIAKNDGLTDIDFFHWLIYPVYKSGKPFDGQIICWCPKVRYLDTDPIVNKEIPPPNPNRKIIRMQ